MVPRHRILLTGASGQVGWELRRALAPLGEIITPSREQFDLASPDAIRSGLLEIQPTLIVNAAAYTAVDKAESEHDLAKAVNSVAPGVLAEEAKRLGAAMVHYSTDYVFDGIKSVPYCETDAVNPLSVYGKTKSTGEKSIQDVNPSYLIFRTSWVYGMRGSNFLMTMLRLAKERDVLRVVDDQHGAPTWCRLIAEATALVIVRWNGESGIYHLTCRGQTTWHGFAQAILHQYSRYQSTNGWPPLKISPEAIEAISTEQYPLPARRPENSVLDNGKLSDTFGLMMPDWQDALSLAMEGMVMQ